MRRILILVAVVALVAGAAGTAWWLAHRRPEWSTRSPAAAAEFEAALAASQKLYGKEAKAHLERAVALDPDFVVAKALLAGGFAGHDTEESRRLADEVRHADLEHLTPRERFLVELTLAQLGHDEARIARLIETYGETHPDDPFVLYVEAQTAWRKGAVEKAETLYRKLTEVAPNWVLAYNELGYMAMGAGRFKDAEDQFVTYRFIAPDQANPHDSLGELYLLTGRYDEARHELEAAIAAKKDFCAAYQHLVFLDLLQGDPQAAGEVIGRASSAGACPEAFLDRCRCSIAVIGPARQGRWEEAWHALSKSCSQPGPPTPGWATPIMWEVAAVMGHGEILERDLERLRSHLEHRRKTSPGPMAAMAATCEAIQNAMAGALRPALDELREADGMLRYSDANLGILKLENRLRMARLESLLGESGDARRTIQSVTLVNPVLARQYRENPDRWLPLPGELLSGDGGAGS